MQTNRAKLTHTSPTGSYGRRRRDCDQFTGSTTEEEIKSEAPKPSICELQLILCNYNIS